jgi:hypothetical protein
VATTAIAQPKRRQPKADDPGTRSLNAMLRWRFHWTLARLPADQAQALRFLPALLQASFASPPLRGEAPGISRLKFRRSWSVLARAFGLPPPLSMQRAKGAIEALILVPRGEALEVFALVASDLPAGFRARAQERLTAAKNALGAAGRHIELKLTDLGTVDGTNFDSMLSMGALIAGSPPPLFYNAAHPAKALPLPSAAILAERAPTPMASLALMLLLGTNPPSALEVTRQAAQEKINARQLSDPSFFCARWASQATGREQLVMTALFWSKVKPRSTGVLMPKELMEAGRELTMLAARSVLRLPVSASRTLRARLRRDVIGVGLPRALLPALGQCKLKLLPAPVPVGRVFEIRSSDGAVLGRGRTGTQARIRALALTTAAGIAPSLENKLAARLAKPINGPTLHAIVETYEIPGPPFDPLNRGPSRAIGIVSATAVLLRDNARPTAFQLTADELLLRICNDTLRGREIEVAPSTPDGQPAAARLARVVALIQKKGGLPAAIEAGGAVLIPKKGRMTRVSLHLFARRPIACNTDPEAFDLSLSPERGARNSGGFAIPGAIACRVFQSDADPNIACVLSQDSNSRLLREEVPLERLEDHLREGQEILRGCTPPAPLASRLADGIEMLLLRHRRTVASMPINVGGAMPFGLWLEIGGEKLQMAQPGGWAAAAQAILSRLPMGDEPVLRISRVETTEKGAPGSAIGRLYIRAMVLRRLQIHLRKQLALIGT